MRLAQNVKDNIKFLYMETEQQLERLSRAFATHQFKVNKEIEGRHEYILNLSNIVQNDCMDSINKKNKSALNYRCLYDATNSLKEISAAVWAISAAQIAAANNLKADSKNSDATPSNNHKERFLREKSNSEKAKQRFALHTTLVNIHNSFALAGPFFREFESGQGVQVCDSIESLNGPLAEYLQHLESEKASFYSRSELVQMVHMFDHLENICLYITRMGESLLSIDNQQILTLHQFRVLDKTIQSIQSTGTDTHQAYSFRPVAETKSGCSISGVSQQKDGDNYFAIYKGGKSDKIRNEKEQFETWDEMFPGVAPKIISFNEKGKSAGLLIEYIRGRTFEQLLLSKDQEALSTALENILTDMKGFWLNTLDRAHSSSAHYMKQLNKRLSKVLAVHPEYNQKPLAISGRSFSSLAQDIERCQQLETIVTTPFSVYTHGDLNIDNVIYEEQEMRSRFIDLHRSSKMDYLQDISVFMVSCYRLQVIDPEVRRSIHYAMNYTYEFTKAFGQEQGDHSFDLRLSLGLARSFITSTRFILDESFANDLFYRGRYLIERLANLNAQTEEQALSNYQLSRDVLNA